MLAGCTALVSPRHRLRGAAAASGAASCQFQGQQRSAPGLHSQQIQSCHFPLQEKFFPPQQVASPTSQHNISSQKGVTELPCSSSYSRNEERAASSREGGQRSQVSDAVVQREKLSMEETAPFSQRRSHGVVDKGSSSGKMSQTACWMERPQARVMERQTGALMAKNAATLWESSKRRENLKRFSEHSTAEDCSEDRAKRLRGSPSEDLNAKFCVNQLGTHWFGENCDKIESVSEIRGSSGLPAALFNSPDQKGNNTYEPRSVLDLVISPGLKPRSFSPACSQPLQQLLTDTADYDQGFTIADLQDIQKSNSGLTNLHQPEALPRTSIPSPFPFSSNAWVESIISDFAGKGQADATNGDPNKTNSSSCSVPPNTHRNDEGNSSANDSGHEGAPHYEFPNIMPFYSGSGAIGTEEQTQMEQGLELVNLLIACAEAVSTKSLHLVTHFISRLGELASPEGSPMHRVAAYFTEGLILRSTKLWPHVFHPIALDLDLSDDDMMTGFQLINHISPIPKFFHYTANEIILKAFEDKDRVHIIDFDIKQGLQWPALFQSLASRPKPPTHVRITGIGESKEDLQDTGDRLAGFAEALNLPFEFHAVVDKLEDVRLWMLHVKEKETVAVNCLLQLHKTLYDNGSALRDLLGLIQSTKPAVVAMVEQEANHNDATFESRFLNSLQYYSAIFDSIDANLPPESPARVKVEQFYAREIRNIIACEGPERTERHENFEIWKHMMEEGGFTQVPLRDREVIQARMLLEMFSCKSYRLKQQDGGLTLGWLDQPLFTASAWEPRGSDGASTSSPT